MTGNDNRRPLLDWREIIATSASWLVIGAICGVGWLSWTVPRQLDRILHNQQQLVEKTEDFDSRITKIEASDRIQDTRLTRMESVR
jgi:hypothetical protein